MTPRRKHFKILTVNILLFALSILLRDTGLLNLEIYGISPLFSLALLVALGMFALELPSFFTGLIVGTLLDTVSSAPTGFNAICFMLIGLFVSLMSNHIFNKNISAAIALCLISSLFYFTLRWFVCDFFTLSIYENVRYLLRYVIPQSVYTSVFMLAFYFIEKKLMSTAKSQA